MEVAITGAIPCAIERERRPGDFHQTEDLAVKALRPRDVLDNYCNVMKCFKFERHVLFSFSCVVFLGLFVFRFSLFVAYSGKAFPSVSGPSQMMTRPTA